MVPGRGTVRVDRSGPRATVVWDRPPVHVFDTALLEDLAAALRSEAVRSAHVIVLHGANHRWSAGFAVEDHMADRVRPMFAAFRALLRDLWEVPGPTLAQVEGPCLGGGLEILAACDLAFATASSTFGQPEIRLGVFPPLAASVDGRTLGPKRASEVLFLGETMPAGRAESFGLISRVVSDGSMEAEVDRVVERLAGSRREALVLLKSAIHANEPAPWAGLDTAEAIYLDRLMALPNAEEGLRAFLEKRTPVWPAPVG